MHINSLLIKPAGPDCNMACRYCFYGEKAALFSPGVHRMAPDTLDMALRQYLELAGPQAGIGFQGGEPTLWGADAFENALNLVNRYRRPGQQVSLSLQTNGLLLDERWARLLARHRVLVGLSMDGGADLHDAYRPDRAGNPTHARVTTAARLLMDAGVEYNTLTVVTAQAAARGRELYDALSALGGYMQFIPCLDEGDLAPTAEEYGAFLIDVFDAWLGDGQPRHYVRLFDEMLIGFMEYRTPSCSFSPRCAANLVIEHDGGVYPCDFFVMPRWKLGDLHTSTLAQMAEGPLLQAFVGRKAALPDGCAACRWLPLCRGGCPAYWEGGRTRFCAGYRAFFAHAQPRLLTLKQRLLREDSPRAAAWRALLATGRNEPCPCGSGAKFKRCCAPIKTP